MEYTKTIQGLVRSFVVSRRGVVRQLCKQAGRGRTPIGSVVVSPDPDVEVVPEVSVPPPLPGSTLGLVAVEADAGAVATLPVDAGVGAVVDVPAPVVCGELVCCVEVAFCVSFADDFCSADLLSDVPSTVSSRPNARFSCCWRRSIYSAVPLRPIINAIVPSVAAFMDRGCFLIVNTCGDLLA